MKVLAIITILVCGIRQIGNIKSIVNNTGATCVANIIYTGLTLCGVIFGILYMCGF